MIGTRERLRENSNKTSKGDLSDGRGGRFFFPQDFLFIKRNYSLKFQSIEISKFSQTHNDFQAARDRPR